MSKDNLLILANHAALDDDGWALIAHAREHPKTRQVIGAGGRMEEQRFIQVLDNESADALLAAENSFFRSLKRALIGIPVYRDHPDLADYAPETAARRQPKTVIGVIDRVRKGDRGIEAHFALTPDGAAAVENDGAKFPSALWLVKPFGRRDDSTLVRPFRLISAGLTPFPNISGVESLANARPTEPAATAEPTQENTMIKQLIIGWLAAKGVILANDATDQAVLDAVQKHDTGHITAATALGNEKTTLAGTITTLENERTQLTQSRDAEKARADQAVTALANEQTARKAERHGRAAAVVDLAITQGRLAVAQREAQITALENAADFAAEAKKLLASAATHKTTTAGSTESGKVLANTSETPQAEYDRHFKTALENCAGDPIRAHSQVMAIPGLAEKLRAKRN